MRTPSLLRTALLAPSLVALAAVLAMPAFAKPAEGPSKTFQPMDLFGLAYASDPEIRPDGGAVS